MRKLVVVALAAFVTVGVLKPVTVRAQDSSAAKPASKFDTLIKDLKKVEGMWTMYHNEQKLLVHLKSSDLSKNYLMLSSIAKGVSSGMVLGGMTWGDDVLWTFKKVGDKIHVLRRNVRFKASPGTPEADAVELAYSDSVLYALPILTDASGGHLVDMTRVFMSDDEQIGRALGGFRFASDRSTWAKIKAFPKNVELQVAAVYAGARNLETVSDPRGVQVGVHYSISELPSNGYKPRKADDRIGYFLTVLKDFSDDSDDQHFVRYINRWDLQKEDPKAELSNPKQRIKFYIEKTVPKNLRPYVQEGIEEWNKAFEKLGFYKAIQVEQQQAGDDWDPEDVRYNTFRWITAEAGFAMGPSRVNPLTGQILDADIIFDASFLRYWKEDYETFTDENTARLLGLPTDADVPSRDMFDIKPKQHAHMHGATCSLCQGMQQQMGFSAAVLMSRGLTDAKGKLPDEFVHQALKEVVMHEVGHTLGLRHNFKASSWKPLSEIDDPDNANEATVASVMDYSPANIVPKDAKQGAYYTKTIGPYDYWAIEYGYKPISGNEDEELKKIAARSAEPGHDYATDDEGRSSLASDPLVNLFDLGKDPLNFAERQGKLASELIPKVVDRSTEEGEGYQKARQAFGMLLSEYWRTLQFAARFPGGVYVHRDHKGDKDGRAPFKVVEAEQQRAAMKLLAERAFAAPEYEPELLNHLAATRWGHWGLRTSSRLDYPIHDTIARMQTIILYRLIYPPTLERIQDNELKVPGDAEAYTMAEHFRTLVEAIFSEFNKPKAGKYTNRKPFVSSFRRNLQRQTVKELAYFVTNGIGVPEDARTLSRMHLVNLRDKIAALTAREDVKLDDYTKAHLQDTQNRIQQVLDAELEVRSID